VVEGTRQRLSGHAKPVKAYSDAVCLRSCVIDRQVGIVHRLESDTSSQLDHGKDRAGQLLGAAPISTITSVIGSSPGHANARMGQIAGPQFRMPSSTGIDW